MAKPKRYFISDFHFGHWNKFEHNGEKCERGIITFERTQFKTIQEHDKYLIDLLYSWAGKWAPGSTLYYLGDFGNTDYLYVFTPFREKGIKVVFIAGNHDAEKDYDKIAEYVDEFHPYPIYLSNKLVVSHYPVAVYEGQVNVCGHLHGSKLADNNHIVASIHVAGYEPISETHINNAFNRIPKHVTRFLYEPWAEDYVFTQPKEDVLMDKNGRIDLSASRMMQKLATEERIKNGEPYRPYCGGIE